jgi:hypothetical protein
VGYILHVSDGADNRRAAWEFPELVALAVLTSFVCLFADNLVKLWLLGSAVGPGVWSWVAYLGQWVSFPVTALLLGAVGICWCRRVQWTDNPPVSPSRTTRFAHVRRLRALSQLLKAAIVLATLCSLATLASDLFTNPPYAGPSFSFKLDMSALLDTISVIVFALLGFTGSNQVIAAATAYLNSVPGDPE